MQETLYLMVTLLDKYLSLVSIKKNEMQLVGLTSLLLASKYEDFWHPKVGIAVNHTVYCKSETTHLSIFTSGEFLAIIYHLIILFFTGYRSNRHLRGVIYEGSNA